MTEERKTLLTVPLSPAELRVVHSAARARGLTTAEWIRSILRERLVDLLP